MRERGLIDTVHICSPNRKCNERERERERERHNNCNFVRQEDKLLLRTPKRKCNERERERERERAHVTVHNVM